MQSKPLLLNLSAENPKMSKEAWFQHYETLYNEREAGEIEGTDEELSEMADERLVD